MSGLNREGWESFLGKSVVVGTLMGIGTWCSGINLKTLRLARKVSKYNNAYHFDSQ